MMEEVISIDERRILAIPGDKEETLIFCVEHFIATANHAIETQGFFAVALSGGSTPKGIYTLLASPEYCSKVNWNKVYLFWSDERSVPPDHEESNYRMAMEAGFTALGVPKENVYRMVAEMDIQQNAESYEKMIREKVPGGQFDLVMLGMGDDGHTASLFPHTEGLKSDDRLVVANFVPEKKTWRMSLTFACINQAKAVAIYVLGRDKQKMLQRVFADPYNPEVLPIQKVGTVSNPALWITDQDAAAGFIRP